MKNIVKIFATMLVIFMFLMSCNEDDVVTDNYQEPSQEVPFQEILQLKKDKAKYNPSEDVTFTVNAVHPNTSIRYKYLGKTLLEVPLISTSWTWTPPSDNFKGYMVELVKNTNGDETILGTVAVDVSSDWTKFPRYGFLSGFGNVNSSQRNEVLDNLKNHHINGIQYYDWQAKHHIPLPLDISGNPESPWVDLFNREMKFETVQGYIDEGHQLNIDSMFYNLLFGAWKPEAGDGFSNQWLIYDDQFHNTINKHDLGDIGDILITNPANQDWQNYIFNKSTDVYNNLDFDGWHLDQLGNRGTVYDYNGNSVNLENGYNSFLTKLNEQFPDKKMVLNAVDQFGQNKILNAPVNFAYTEVWSREQYSGLAQVILENNQISNNQLNTVLAAYLNYDSSEGTFNTPSVLLADAVIFAFGGSHLELGEHMLSSEYFPNNKLSMDNELKSSLLEYYDFMVAYENLLRDGGEFLIPNISSNSLKVNNWPPLYGSVSLVGKKVANKQVFQLLNFNGVNTLNWRDNSKTQTAPRIFKDVEITINNPSAVSKVWFASPDFRGGASQELEFEFESTGNQIKITVPYLEYWSMIVLEN